MRIDKFLNATNVLKRRNIAKEMLESALVRVNGGVAKPSREVRVGDKIEITFLEYTKTYEVLKIPESKNVKKSEKEAFVREV